MTETPRSLIAQWRENAKLLRAPDDGTRSWVDEQGHADGLEEAANELEAALTPLADLEAEMRRFAEAMYQALVRQTHRACKFNCDAEGSACQCPAHQEFRKVIRESNAERLKGLTAQDEAKKTC